MSLWDEYQEFSTNAKPYGGANAYLSFLENNAKEGEREAGRIEGGIIVGLVMLVGGGIVYGGIRAFGKAKEYFIKRNQKKQLVSEVRQEFLDNVERYEKNESDESPEN